MRVIAVAEPVDVGIKEFNEERASGISKRFIDHHLGISRCMNSSYHAVINTNMFVKHLYNGRNAIVVHEAVVTMSYFV